jgi:hypothetical protein
MRLAMFKGEKSIEDLAARLFQVKAGDAEARKRASAALIEANPQLANLDRVPPGSVVVVPDAPHAVNAGEVVEPAIMAARDLARSVAEHVTAFTAGLADAASSAAAQANATLQLLQDPSLKRAADADPALKQRLTAIEQNTTARLDDVEAKQALVQQAVAQMQKDLAKFFPPAAPSPVPSPPPPSPTGGPPSPRPRPDRPPVGPAQPAVAPVTPKAKKPARRGRRKTKPK